MSTTAAITFPVSAEAKEKAEREARKQGFDLSYFLRSVVYGFSSHAAKNNTIQIAIEVPSEYFKKTLAKARANRKAGKGSPVFDNAEEHNKWLEEQGI